MRFSLSSQLLAIPSEAEMFHCDMERSCKPQVFNKNALINCYLLSITEVNLYREELLKTSCYYKQNLHFVCSWNVTNLLSSLQHYCTFAHSIEFLIRGIWGIVKTHFLENNTLLETDQSKTVRKSIQYTITLGGGERSRRGVFHCTLFLSCEASRKAPFEFNWVWIRLSGSN